MKTKKIILFLPIFFLAIFLLGYLFAKAEEPMATENTSDNKDAEILATVGIEEGTIVSQQNNNLKIKFKLVNGSQVQPGARYSVVLIDESGLIADNKVYPEIVNLRENEKVEKEVEYNAPVFFKGKYEVWVVSQNIRGMDLSQDIIGTVEFNGSGEFVELKMATCYLKIKNSTDGEKYSIQSGIDVGENEELESVCQAINNFKKPVTVVPQFETYYRTTLSEPIATDTQSPITFASGEEKEIAFAIPKAKKPQAYDAVLSFLNAEKEIVSNKITFHYITKGQSATIGNLRLDKDYYNKGDMAKVSFLWFGSADNFFESRGEGTNLNQVNLTLSISEKNGEKCAGIFQKDLNLSTIQNIFEIPIISDCQDPKIKAEIKSGETILDSATFEINSSSIDKQKSENVQNPEKNKESFFKSRFFPILIGFVFLLVSLFVIIYFSRKNRGISIFFLLVISSLLFFGAVSDGQAAGASFVLYFEHRDSFIPVTFTGNIDKSIYRPGETIRVTGSASVNFCNNRSVALSMTANGRSLFSYGSLPLLFRVYGSTTLAAPSTPGTYCVYFGGSLRQFDKLSPVTSGRNVCYSVQSPCYCNDTANYCSGTTYVNYCGNVCTGTKVCCTDTSWTPDSSNYCFNTSFTQTSNCGNTRVVAGTKTDTYWTPNTSTQCSGIKFTQTGDCGTPREAIGTMPSLPGQCGSAASKLWEIKPNSDLCSFGTSSDPMSFGNQWCWTCSGICEGSATECCAQRDSNWKEVAP